MSGLLRAVELERGARLALPGAWVHWGCVGSVVALLAVGVLLVARRLAGAITGDLSLPHLIVTAVVVGVAVLGARLGWQWLPLSRERRGMGLDAVVGWGGSLALVLVALGCSAGRGWDWLVWLPLVGAEQWQLRWFLRDSGSRVRSHVRSVTERATERHDVDESVIPPLAPPFEGGGIELQRVVRVRDEDGAEAIRATLRAEFATGQRQATLHVAFCPPLERVPVIEMEAVEGAEGADVELKVGVAYCHGARVEVRLGEPAEEDCAVVVEIVARPQDEIERG